MSNIRSVRTVIWCQTSDNSYMSGVVWYQTNNMRRLITVMTAHVWCQTSDKSYMTAHVWCQTFWHQMSDVWYDIRHLITVTWQQTSDVRCLLSYNWYQTSDVWFYMWCCITVIRCLMSNIRCLVTVIWQQSLITVIWQQTSDNSYMTADVWCQLSYNCYQTSDVLCYVITVISYMMADVW